MSTQLEVSVSDAPKSEGILELAQYLAFTKPQIDIQPILIAPPESPVLVEALSLGSVEGGEPRKVGLEPVSRFGLDLNV